MTSATHSHILFVPRELKHALFAPGSAILSSVEEAANPAVIVYYEGNLYRFDNIKTFADKAMHAADRQSQRYPTSAMACIDREDLIEVGTYDLAQQRITSITERDLLVAWAPEDACNLPSDDELSAQTS